MPEGRIWTAKDDSVTLPTWLGIPGLRHTLGLSRWWHFSVNLLWLINGVGFYVLLFSTNQWHRVVPVTWEVFPAALSTAIQYASLNFPVDEGWTRYNGLQQLSYFITIFIAAPVSIATGLMQSPAISNTLGWFGRLFNRQAMRSIHFISFGWFVAFILAHGAMVFVTGLRQNTNHMFGGVNNASWTGFPLFLLAMAVLIVAWLIVSPLTLRYARLVQHAGTFMIGWLMAFTERLDPHAQLARKEISPYFWPNGTMPNSNEFDDLLENNFVSYRLRVSGLVENHATSPSTNSRPWRNKNRSRRISAFRAGQASPNGAVSGCATSSIWLTRHLRPVMLCSTRSLMALMAGVTTMFIPSKICATR